MPQYTIIKKEVTLMFGVQAVLHFTGDNKTLFQVDFRQLRGTREDAEWEEFTWCMGGEDISGWLKKLAEECDS